MTTALRLVPTLLLVLLLSACGNPGTTDLWGSSTINKAKERGRLRIAMEPKFPPFESIKGGELVGFDVDLGRILAAEAEIEVEFLQVDFDGIIGMLESDRCDLIISGMTATPLRALRVSYSDPYFLTVTCLLVSKERASDVKSVEDLNRPGRKIAVKTGTTGYTAAKVYCPKAELLVLDEEVDAANEVANGRADAFIYDRLQIEMYGKKHEGKTFTILDQISVEPYAIACRKGDPDTLNWLNLVLKNLRRDGRMEQLYAKWGLESGEER